MPPKIKHRVRTKVFDLKGRLLHDQEGTDNFDYGRSTYVGKFAVPMKIGETTEYTVTVQYLGEKQCKTTFAQRTKAQERSRKRKETEAKKELEKKAKELLQRQKRIVNQIELAFVKQVATAVDFITCDKCDGVAKFLGLVYENPGSSVIDPDQISGAWCQDHDQKHERPFKTKAAIACERLEFFYDGLRQLYVKAAALEGAR